MFGVCWLCGGGLGGTVYFLLVSFGRAVGSLFFFFNDTATAVSYTLSLLYAHPVWHLGEEGGHLSAFGRASG